MEIPILKSINFNIMITKTQYNYTCTKDGFLKTFQLVVGISEAVLWEGNVGTPCKGIEEAEMVLCLNYKDVLLVSKVVTEVTKIEKPIQLEISIKGDTEKWCKCNGAYSQPEDIICSKCKNPIA
jgi:hypothetical protein